MSSFLLISGIVCVAVASVLLFLDVLRCRRAVGVVIGNDASDGEGGFTYAPRIRFRTQDGIDREFQSAVYIHGNPCKYGKEIPVRYHPVIHWLNGIDRWYCRLVPVLFFVFCGSVFLWAHSVT